MTITTQRRFQSPSMPPDQVDSWSQREPSGANHRVGRSRGRILTRTAPIIGFPDLLINVQMAIRRQYGISNQTRAHLCLMSFKSLWLVLRTSLQGNLARAHQPAREWQRLAQHVPSGQSCTISIHYRCFFFAIYHTLNNYHRLLPDSIGTRLFLISAS